MAIILPGGFTITNVDPVDSRITVADASSRLGFSAANIYEGLLVYQQDTNELYVLIDTDNYNSNSGWKLVGSNVPTGSFATTGSNTFIGNQYITGSLTVSGSIIGTSSFASTSVSSSFASTASYVLNAVSSSFASTSSYATITEQIGAVFDGLGGNISINATGYYRTTYPFSIINYYIDVNNSGSIQFDLRVNGASIVVPGGNLPTLTSATSSSAAITSWATASLTSGTLIQYIVTGSAPTVSWSKLTLTIKRT